MSDPVSNAEIEDVLSSIRRLVSVDERTDSPKSEGSRATAEDADGGPPDNPREEYPAAQEAPTPEEDARLILTPSFRVSPEEGDAQDAGEADDSKPESTGHLTLGQWQVSPDATDIEEAIEDGEEDAAETFEADAWGQDEESSEPQDAAEDILKDDDSAWLEEDVTEDAAQAKDWQSDEDTEQARSSDDWYDESPEMHEARAEKIAQEVLASEAEAQKWDADLPEMALDDAGLDESTSTLDEEETESKPTTSELEARIAEVEAAVAAREDQWEPDGVSEDAYAGGQTEPLPWEDHLEDTASAFAPFEMPQEEREIASGVQDQSMSVDAGGVEEQSWREPLDGGEEPDAAADEGDTVPEPAFQHTPEPTDDAENGKGPSPEPRPADRFSAPSAPGPSKAKEAWYEEETDTILDEEALRDLVSEIVRQELQGTLGERITRNVRKLVRREIHRAMMGQDFD